MMNQSNGVLGIIFYSIQILFGKINNSIDFICINLFLIFSSGLIAIPLFTKLALFSSVLACLGSIYLAFILAFVLKDLCILCITTYIINAALLWSNYQAVFNSH